MVIANGTSPIIKERTAIHLLKGCVEGYKLSSTKAIDYTKSNALALCLGITPQNAVDLVMEVINSDKTSEEAIAQFNTPTRELKEKTLAEIQEQRKAL